MYYNFLHYPISHYVQPQHYFLFYNHPNPYYYLTTPSPFLRYPPIDPTTFHKSSNEAKRLLADASILINQLAASKDLETKIMTAAQVSDQKQVELLVKSTGIKRNVRTTYTPDGIHFTLKGSVAGEEVCSMDIALRW